jgi:hypothetical protein
MVITQAELKRCRCCRRELPLTSFYIARPGQSSSRCKRCHGLALRRCRVCRRIFIAKPGRKACSALCSQLMRAPTFLICRHCGQVFGPVEHLERKYCSKRCAYANATTGRLTVRKSTREARSAQSLLRYHVQAGHIIRPSVCEECGANSCKIEAAHYDYAEPLRVRWLCCSCHRRWDMREPKGATYILSGPGRRRRDTHEKTPTAMAGVSEQEGN